MSLPRQMALMRRAPILSILDEDALRLIAFNSQTVRLRPRQTLFRKGEPATGAVLVLGGQLLIEDGAHAARTVGVGQMVDEMALVVERPRPMSALAHVSCEVLLIPRSQMRRLLEEDGTVARRLQRLLATRTAALADALGKANRAPPS